MDWYHVANSHIWEPYQVHGHVDGISEWDLLLIGDTYTNNGAFSPIFSAKTKHF